MPLTTEDFARERYMRACEAVRTYERAAKRTALLPRDPVEFRLFMENWRRAKVEKDQAREDWHLRRNTLPPRSKTVRLSAR